MNNYVSPRYVSGTGNLPIFGNKKKWEIRCGGCSASWEEKVYVAEPSTAKCPFCGTVNQWSVVKFLRQYEKMLGGEG